MIRAELDGVVITEHDAYWSEVELGLLRRVNPNHKIYLGVEISARDGHVLSIGAKVPLKGSRERTIESLATEIDALGGCAIWVHPFQGTKRWSTPAKTVHAVEVRSTVTFGKSGILAERLATSLGVVRVAGSDAHALDHLGTAGVVIETLPDDERELSAFIRSGHVQPFMRTSVVTS